MEPEPAASSPPIASSSRADLLKSAALVALALLVAGMAYYFYLQLTPSFTPGRAVDEGTFKEIFANATRVSIVMDVRGAADNATATNIMQCGVDFAGSTGMGGKEMAPFSISGDGCVAQDGQHPLDWCISALSDGITIYVREGSGVSYYDNAMVVGVGPQYPLGSCGIKRV
jgi:hypothetical protein